MGYSLFGTFNCVCNYLNWRHPLVLLSIFSFWTKNSVQCLWIWRGLVTNVLYNGQCRAWRSHFLNIIGCCNFIQAKSQQWSIAPDYSYKTWTTNREAPRAYTQPEGIGYLVGTVSRGRSNFVIFWTKIWPAEQPKAMNDTPSEQFLTYSRARRSVFLLVQ